MRDERVAPSLHSPALHRLNFVLHNKKQSSGVKRLRNGSGEPRTWTVNKIHFLPACLPPSVRRIIAIIRNHTHGEGRGLQSDGSKSRYTRHTKLSQPHSFSTTNNASTHTSHTHTHHTHLSIRPARDDERARTASQCIVQDASAAAAPCLVRPLRRLLLSSHGPRHAQKAVTYSGLNPNGAPSQHSRGTSHLGFLGSWPLRRPMSRYAARL